MRGQPAHYLEHDELIAGNNYSYLKLSEKLKRDIEKQKRKKGRKKDLEKGNTLTVMLPPPLNKFLLFAAFFFLVGKDLMRQKGVRDELE